MVVHCSAIAVVVMAVRSRIVIVGVMARAVLGVSGTGAQHLSVGMHRDTHARRRHRSLQRKHQDE